MSEYKPAAYFNMGKWVQPVLPGVEWCYWNTNEAVRKSSRGYSFEPLLVLDGNFPTKKSDAAKLEKIIGDITSSNEVAAYHELLEGVGREYEGKHLDVLQHTDASIQEYLPQLLRTYREVVGFWTFTLLLGDVMDSYILKHKLAASPEEMLAKMAPYARITWLEEQSHEIKGMAQQILAQRPTTAATDINNELLLSLGISSRIDKHVKKFRWFGTHHWLGEGYDRAKCIQDIAAIVQKGITSREKKVGGAKQSNDSFWQLLATVSYWRTHCAEVTSKVVFESRSKLEQCARQWNLDYPGLLNLSAKEIIERLGKDSAVSLPEHYEQRQEAFGCYIDEAGQEKIIVGDELTRLLRKLVPLVNTDVDEFKGVIANKGGIIIGIAKVLISPRDFTKFEAGDILVAPETTPDFVPLMKKAKAIITDRGGITSHAAIVSRELGIPCVIGTKIATQVLKDGDEVEVDANKGVIKVLNSV